MQRSTNFKFENHFEIIDTLILDKYKLNDVAEKEYNKTFIKN